MSEQKSAKKILVIDDDPMVNKLVQSVLTKQGYEVMVALEAPQGLEMAMTQPPDLIVLDVMMPIINGFNVCRLMKSQISHRHIPIVLLTSRSTNDDRRIGDEVGANAYLAKPFQVDELIATVSTLLASGERA